MMTTSGPCGALSFCTRTSPTKDAVRRLRLDVDRPPLGRGERIDGQRRDLVDRGPALPGRHGPGNGDDGVAELRLEAGRPGIVAGLDGADVLARGDPPAFARELGDGAGGVAVDHHLHVVHRRIGARQDRAGAGRRPRGGSCPNDGR